MTYLIRSAVEENPIFCMMLARCELTVLTLMNNSSASRLGVHPAPIIAMICSSRVLSLSWRTPPVPFIKKSTR